MRRRTVIRKNSRPDHRDRTPWDPTSFIADLDRYILTPLYDYDLDRWELIFIVDSEALHHSSEGVLEKLETYMRAVR